MPTPRGILLAVAVVTSVLMACQRIQPGEMPAPARPNILLVVADDLGYSDLGSYGGEISTPRLDRLAKEGVRFSNFYVAATCSTTRSMLLTGVDHHLNGLGGLDEAGRLRADGVRGYEGHLNDDVVTVATLLRESGYHTYMTGKWHLGNAPEAGPEYRGFESSFVTPGGAASHFSLKGVISGRPTVVYRENGEPATPPEGFYSTNFFTDKLIEYIDTNAGDGRPFFAYAAYTAPHWPLQAPDEFIDRYNGTYVAGYDAIRNARLARMRELGFFVGTPATIPGNPVRREWADVPDDVRRRESRRMQVYAAMVESLDANIGRLLDHLDDIGELENTAIIFISDNGPEGNDPYVIARNETYIPENFTTDTESLGKPNSYAAYGPGWAMVSATPFRLYKTFPTEGGLRVPAIFSLPGVEARSSLPDDQFASVLDIAPTIIELAGVAHPASTGNDNLLPLQGISMLPYLEQRADAIHEPDDAVGWELFGRAALIRGRWKLVRVTAPYGDGTWKLYDLAMDPDEAVDRSASEPDVFRAMLNRWAEYKEQNNVIDYDYTDLQYGKVNKHYER